MKWIHSVQFTYSARVSKIPCVSQPTTKMIVSGATSDVIHHQSTSCTSIV